MVLDAIVANGGLDGVHMTNVATVDGLDSDRYFAKIAALASAARR